MLKDLQEPSVGDLTETENEDDDELPKRTKRKQVIEEDKDESMYNLKKPYKTIDYLSGSGRAVQASNDPEF